MKGNERYTMSKEMRERIDKIKEIIKGSVDKSNDFETIDKVIRIDQFDNWMFGCDICNRNVDIGGIAGNNDEQEV